MKPDNPQAHRLMYYALSAAYSPLIALTDWHDEPKQKFIANDDIQL